MRRSLTTLLKITLILSLVSPLPALAQQPPDAGRILQENRPPRLTEPQKPDTDLTIPSQPGKKITPGGPTVRLSELRFNGNTCFSDKILLQAAGEVTGNSFDLAGLYDIAEKITQYYHKHGFPFARTFLSAQKVTDGVLHFDIVEGRYGKVQTQGDEKWRAGAQGFLASLKSGDVIESDTLERATLVLRDQPGIKIMPVLRPGQDLGTGDLFVKVSRTPLVRGDVRLDNHGNRYTGALRLNANVQFDSPFLFGDQILVQAIYTEEDLWVGNLAYSLPVGSSGLRATASYAQSYYELGKDFSSLDAHGTAKIPSVKLSYPVVRSQQSNLSLSTSLQYKKLNDQQDSTSTDNDKSSKSGVLAMSFDHRDALGWGGVTYGVLSYTYGHLKLDSELEAVDRVSHTDTCGDFSKLNLDVARLQALPVNFILYGRASFQLAGKNLDSSESISLGGPDGVRAYPVGESFGDEGWFAQFELRYKWRCFSPYIFYDMGGIRTNAEPEKIRPAVQDNTRSLSGSGLGVRYTDTPWNMDVNVAWRNHGGEPTSDSRDRNPRVWASVGYKF